MNLLRNIKQHDFFLQLHDTAEKLAEAYGQGVGLLVKPTPTPTLEVVVYVVDHDETYQVGAVMELADTPDNNDTMADWVEFITSQIDAEIEKKLEPLH